MIKQVLSIMSVVLLFIMWWVRLKNEKIPRLVKPRITPLYVQLIGALTYFVVALLFSHSPGEVADYTLLSFGAGLWYLITLGIRNVFRKLSGIKNGD
ncbi:hypothetical protein [Effusibacillus pohliae]|uniref:hypothetical protein n=1 Tax=Effusibacillus pohliae TaxID=232270 RepID=UPI0012EA49A9|nr:hypothetical protein [Effusibacillus pohliae]